MFPVHSLFHALRTRSVDVLVECRNCGTTLDSVADSCPMCDSIEVARYEL